MFKDQKIESLIHQELVRQTEGIELIAFYWSSFWCVQTTKSM